MNTPKNHPPKSSDSFPGYPPYPASEDITQHNQRVEVHKLFRAEEQMPEFAEREPSLPQDPEAPQTDADIGQEEKDLLNAAFQNRRLSRPDLEEPLLDTSDDLNTALNEQHPSYNLEGSDLDVPGAEDDDASEAIGSEDEENNYYSLGQESLPDQEVDEDL